jgi:hypothetical protein
LTVQQHRRSFMIFWAEKKWETVGQKSSWLILLGSSSFANNDQTIRKMECFFHNSKKKVQRLPKTQKTIMLYTGSKHKSFPIGVAVLALYSLHMQGNVKVSFTFTSV